MLLTLFEFSALDGNYQMALHARQNAAQATGLSEEGVKRASDALLDYLRGREVDLAYADEVYGQTRRVFEDRELEHMADVLNLFEAGRAIRLALALTGLLLTVWGVVLTRSLGTFFETMLQAALAWTALIALAIGLAALNFDRAFIAFHEILFTNDLWMMDDSQLMIRMLPQAFFMTLAGHIALTCAGGLAALIAVSACGARILGKRRKEMA